MPWPEECHYCGRRYHPMMVWTLREEAPPEGQLTREKWLQWQEERVAARNSGKPVRIHACTIMVIDDGTNIGIEEWADCAKRAEADGYVKRPDLTPSR